MPFKSNLTYVKLESTDKIRYLGQCLAQKCQTDYDTEGINSVATYLQNNITPIENARAWIKIFDPAYKEVGRSRAHPPKEFITQVFHDVLVELFQHNECVRRVFRIQKFVFTMAGLFTGEDGTDQPFHQDVFDASGPFMTIIFNFDLTGKPLGGSTVFSTCRKPKPTDDELLSGWDKNFTVAADQGVIFGGKVWHYGVGGKKRVALMITIKAESVHDPNIDQSLVDEYVQFTHLRSSLSPWPEDMKTKIRNAMMPLTQDNKRQRTHP